MALKWKSSYTITKVDLGANTLRISVHYDNNGEYSVELIGSTKVQLTKKFTEKQEAMKAGVQLAKRHLLKMLADVETLEKQEAFEIERGTPYN